MGRNLEVTKLFLKTDFWRICSFLLLTVDAIKDNKCYENLFGTVFHLGNVKNDFSGTGSDIGFTINITSRNIRIQPQLTDNSFINTEKWRILYKYLLFWSWPVLPAWEQLIADFVYQITCSLNYYTLNLRHSLLWLKYNPFHLRFFYRVHNYTNTQIVVKNYTLECVSYINVRVSTVIATFMVRCS